MTWRRALVLLAAGLPLAACGSAGTSSGPAPSVPAGSGSGSGSLSSRPVGTVFRVSAIGPGGKPASYTVVLVSVNEDAAPGSSSPSPVAGGHLVAAQFRITGVSGTSSEDADIDAELSGTNKQEYHSIGPGGTTRNGTGSGDFRVSGGRSQIRYVEFELPAGVLAATITWTPSLVGSGGTWTTS